MTPEIHLAWTAAALCALGLTLVLAAFITAGREHRRQT